MKKEKINAKSLCNYIRSCRQWAVEDRRKTADTSEHLYCRYLNRVLSDESTQDLDKTIQQCFEKSFSENIPPFPVCIVTRDWGEGRDASSWDIRSYYCPSLCPHIENQHNRVLISREAAFANAVVVCSGILANPDIGLPLKTKKDRETAIREILDGALRVFFELGIGVK